MEVVGIWKGWHANLLRVALRLTFEAFAEELGTAVRTVTKWSAEPDIIPMPEMQRALDTRLAQADDAAKARFTWLTSEQDSTMAVANDAGMRLANDPGVTQILDWIDEHAGWRAGTARHQTSELLGTVDLPAIRDLAQVRSRVGRAEVAEALAAYYDVERTDHVLYRAVSGGIPIQTSILTQPDWLDLDLTLGTGLEDVRLSAGPDSRQELLDSQTAKAAMLRATIALVAEVKIVNSALYRLVTVQIGHGHLSATFGITDFITYALTSDLLETELLDWLTGKRKLTRTSLPLRNRYLPDVQSVVSLEDRICAGGTLALFAAARPPRRGRRSGDYVLLVQERAGHVLNAAQRLAVIPKAFHQPIVDYNDDSQISSTLEREMEEELFGRADIDSALGRQLHADPMHVSRLSKPMQWLTEHPETERWHMECTGFGFNLVSGNFEFASMIVIDDERWWAEFGGQVETNWETAGLRTYSSLNVEAIGSLVHDRSWSNEGLFAFLQGIRRLSAIGGSRVDLPEVELELDQ